MGLIMTISVADRNASNKIIVQNIRTQTIGEIQRIIEPHLHDSGFVKMNGQGANIGSLQICTFGDYEDGQPIAYDMEDREFSVQGFTEEGVIVDSFMTIATMDWEDLNFDEAAFALDVAIEQYGEK